MIIHRASGYKLLLRMLAAALGPQLLRGFPAARTAADKRDEALLPFLGEPHDATLGARWKAAPRTASASATGSSVGGASRESAAASQQKTWSSPTSCSWVG